MLRWTLTHIVGPVIAIHIRRQLAEFEQATQDPQKAQTELLQRIVAFQSDTDFGRDHHFNDIRSVADFRKNVPVAGYEEYEPYLQRVRAGDFKALLADSTVHMFALTSGTTASRKYIPVTPRYLADYKRGWNMWGLRVFDDYPSIALRPILQMSGDSDEFRTEGNIPCGAVTGLTAKMQKRIVQIVYCVPHTAGRIRDAWAKYYTVLRLSMGRPVGLIIAANPSTLVNLARTGDREKEALIRDFYDGTLNRNIDIAPEIRARIMPRLRRQRVAARRLEEIVRRTGTLYPRDYWGNDCLLGNWTGGTVSFYMRHYPRYFGDMRVRDVGLIASEGRMTIPFKDGTPSGILDVTSHYFEFIPEGEIDSPQPTVLGAHELQEGRNYYLLPTTACGFYRYHISDLVRVTGFHNRTPLLEFLSKGSHFANITGEKISEYQVAQAMAQVQRELNLTLTSYSLAPCWNDVQPYYGLFVEGTDLAAHQSGTRLAERLDYHLACLNTEYASKRQSDRLGLIRTILLPQGAWQAWDRRLQALRGGTFEQYKHPCLVSDPKFHEAFLPEPVASPQEAARRSEPVRAPSV
jgi:hypothetical protein